jgi:hypothetical protein
LFAQKDLRDQRYAMPSLVADMSVAFVPLHKQADGFGPWRITRIASRASFGIKLLRSKSLACRHRFLLRTQGAWPLIFGFQASPNETNGALLIRLEIAGIFWMLAT